MKEAQITLEDVAIHCCVCPQCQALHQDVTPQAVLKCWLCNRRFKTSADVEDNSESTRVYSEHA